MNETDLWERFAELERAPGFVRSETWDANRMTALAIARVPDRRDRKLLAAMFVASGMPPDPDLRDVLHAIAVQLSGDNFDPVWGPPGLGEPGFWGPDDPGEAAT
jgi:hypothetical protein